MRVEKVEASECGKGEAKVKVLESVVCPFCACLCDDVVIAVDEEAKRVKEVRNACVLGIKKFLAAGSAALTETAGRIRKPRVRGKETTEEEALKNAVSILKEAKKPLVYGLGNTGYNAQRIALEICRKKRGVLDISEVVCHNLFYQVLQKHLAESDGGEAKIYYATLEQIREKASLVIYWGANPFASHPRHLSKFSFYPAGMYALRGAQDRELVAVDVVETPLKKIAKTFLRVPCGEDWRVAEILRRLVSGETAGVRELAEGLDFATLSAIATKMKNAFFGVIFVGLGVLAGRNAERNISALLSLVEALNAQRCRFVLFPMKGHFNVAGAVTLLLRETGFPFSVDFSEEADAEARRAEVRDEEDKEESEEREERVACEFKPGVALEVLERREVDAALILGADPLASLPRSVASALLKIPTVVIDPFESLTAQFATVVLPSAITGVEAEDIAYRMDFLPLRLQKIVESEFPSDAEILREIYRNL